MMCSKKVFYLALGLSLVSSSAAFAGEEVTLRQLLEEAYDHNFDIQAALSRSDAAKAKISPAKALDDPMIGVMFWNVPRDTVDVQQAEEINYRIEQKIPFPGKRHVRGKVARWDALAVDEISRGRINDILLDVQNTYYDIYRIDRSLEVNQENQRLFKQFLGAAKAAYATRKASINPPLKAQVELSKLENEEIHLAQERIAHQSHLIAILNRSTHEAISIPKHILLPQLHFTLEQITAMALETRPEIRATEAAAQRDRTRLTVAKEKLIPDFALSAEYNERPGRQDAWTGTAMINLPIFFWGKNRGEIREAQALLKAAEAEQQSMRVHSQHEIDEAYSSVKAAEQSLALYEKGILPQAKTMFASAREAYATMNIDFLTLIDAARTYRELSMSYYETQAALGKSFAQLERLVGKHLEE